MRHFKQTTLSLAAAQALMVLALPAMAQSTEAPKSQQLETVVVSGQRAALQSAQKLKQDSDEIVDSIVADDIGKLPDRSVSEVLQRIVGVTMDRVMARGDPMRFSVEGSGVIIRGLTYVSSQLNGRESFSANGGRGLSFEDVPPELMAGVDVYKNPSAEQIEGAIGGLVNLRTALPFDYNGFKAGLGVSLTKNVLRDNQKPAVSGLLSNTWNTDIGKIGLLIHAANSKSSTRTDGIAVDPYFREVVRWNKPSDTNNRYFLPTAENHWFPKAVGWQTLAFDRTRQGTYAAAQWKKDTLQASATFFRSKYDFYWDESSIASQADPYSSVVSNATWGANGALLTGTLTDPTNKGIPFNANTRFSKSGSDTKESTFNLVWTPSPQWRIANDFQFIESRSSNIDSTVATGINMPKETLDLTGEMPRLVLDAQDKAYLADPSKYYWGFTMERLSESKATQKAWKGDIKYSFDHPVLYDVRFGLRFTDRDVTNKVPRWYNWQAVSQTWQSAEFDAGAVGQSWDWHPIKSLAYLSRFGGETQVKPFNNFMNGKSSVASLVLPTMAVAAGYPDSYSKLHSYYVTLCEEYKAEKISKGGNPTNTCNPAFTPPVPGAQERDNQQHETTKTAYTQLRFGFDEWKVPVDGNVGLRVVNTRYNSSGYRSLTYQATDAITGTLIGGPIPVFTSSRTAIEAGNSYTDVLPTLNLRYKFKDNLFLRFAFAKAIARPDFSTLQPTLILNAGSATVRTIVDETVTPSVRTNYVDDLRNRGSALGNPALKPVKSDQFDLSGEWYIDKTSSVTMAVFNKKLKDVIVNQVGIATAADNTGKLYDFTYSTQVNGSKGWARGVELSVQHYFNGLPGLLAGLGVQANATYVDSKQTRYNAVGNAWCSSASDGRNLNLFANGCDTNGQSYGDHPLPNLSRKAFNLAVLYDHGPISARVAYSWRGKFHNGVAFPDNTGPNQTNGLNANPDSPQYGRNNMPLGLPIWTDDFGQLDMGVQYRFNSNLTFAFEGQNLTDAIYKQMMQQHIGFTGRSWFASGPRYSVSARLNF
ncbi:TonB-dependent receptor [Roseateles asaccharophilus]|uniref:TonB-dependent receptor n=1 Tax=Roseateles asaccharophilus TaxID=582607 RepID=A0ABU2A6E3_9BURK|nr:TonB-dependent receptor [Roseateles asaccharophilus]MDR7332052.1 TonB-dependent receptor [Roseateles asaccharophilus]